jgi:hypothetical protein
MVRLDCDEQAPSDVRKVRKLGKGACRPWSILSRFYLIIEWDKTRDFSQGKEAQTARGTCRLLLFYGFPVCKTCILHTGF